MNFEYMFQMQPQDSIDIEDPGNCCLDVFNDNLQEYFLITKTDLGYTTVEQFGPLMVDMDTKGPYFNYNLSSFDSNEKKLYQTIYRFLNDEKKAITQVSEVDSELAKEKLRRLFN